MPVPYKSIAIANNFIEKFGKKSNGIEHLKLQKLVYCSYGWWLASYGEEQDRLLKDGPDIWKHGPVFDDLYHSLKVFGSKPITEMKSLSPFSPPENVDEDDEDVRDLLSWIWERYGHLSGFALSDLTHKAGTPWHKVAVENEFRVQPHTKIPDRYIFQEFSDLLTEMGGERHIAKRRQANADTGAASVPN